MNSPNIFWFRRDLRLNDNSGLFHALRSGLPVLPGFIFDRNILDELENKWDARVGFIYEALMAMQNTLIAMEFSLEVFYGKPLEVFSLLTERYQIENVFINEDYEPYARERDLEVEGFLKKKGVGFQTYKDHVIFSKQEILKDDNTPYTVFTSYSNKWKTQLNVCDGKPMGIFKTEKLLNRFVRQPARSLPSLISMGFSSTGIKFTSTDFSRDHIKKYGELRDFPGYNGTSRLGVHLRLKSNTRGIINLQQLVNGASPFFSK